MGWIYLVLAILFEVAGTVSLRQTEGLRHLWPTVAMTLFYIAAFALLALAVRTISLSVAYAIWAGLGTALIAAIGIVVFAEPATAARIGFIALIIVGVIGLQAVSGGH